MSGRVDGYPERDGFPVTLVEAIRDPVKVDAVDDASTVPEDFVAEVKTGHTTLSHLRHEVDMN